jgi:hypothetical protein
VGDHAGDRQSDSAGGGKLHFVRIQIAQVEKPRCCAMGQHSRGHSLIEPLPGHRVLVERHPCEPLIEMLVIRKASEAVDPVVKSFQHSGIS